MRAGAQGSRGGGGESADCGEGLGMKTFAEKYYTSKQGRRLRGWDYTSYGDYFVTICAKEKAQYFGKIVNNKMKLSPIGVIVQDIWNRVPEHTIYVKLDEYIIMPDHVHGIVRLTNDRHTVRSAAACCGATDTGGDAIIDPNSLIKQNSLSSVVRSFKSACTKKISRQFPNFQFQWQSRFYDHIIRNEKSLVKICWYIRNNPKMWDKEGKNDWWLQWSRVMH
jgi:REP element-mobilizing transposase RayT